MVTLRGMVSKTIIVERTSFTPEGFSEGFKLGLNWGLEIRQPELSSRVKHTEATEADGSRTGGILFTGAGGTNVSRMTPSELGAGAHR